MTELMSLPESTIQGTAEFQRTRYLVHIPRGITVDQLSDPKLWIHTRRMFQVNTLLECVAVDGSFDVLLRVTAINSGELRFRVLRQWEMKAESKEVVMSDSLSVKWRGPHDKFTIVNESGEVISLTNGIIAKGLENKDIANQTLEDHRKAIASG